LPNSRETTSVLRATLVGPWWAQNARPEMADGLGRIGISKMVTRCDPEVALMIF